MSMIRITHGLSIPERELRFTFTTSGGPGGQNVNKVATRAVLLFDVGQSAALTDLQRDRIRGALGSRISKDGVLQLTCSTHRTQEGNRRGAMELFVRLLSAALRPRRIRHKTRPTRASSERRLAGKRVRSQIKRTRRSRGSDE